MRILKRITTWVLLCFLLLMAAAPTAYAADDDFRLTVRYGYDGVPIPDARFHLFLVGDVAADGTLSLTGEFSGYPVIVNGQSASGLQTAADTLYGYAQRDQISPIQVAATSASGHAAFFSLSRGLYLVAGQPCNIDGTLYQTQPQLIAVTEDLILEAKCEAQEEPMQPQTISVLKKWVDEGYESKRPDSISVSLLQDGYVLETVTLNAENNWRHTWTDLEPGWEWSVAEDCPDQFAVTLQREGDTFVLTNTRTVFPQDPPPPTVPQTGTHAPAIPQTGLVWWPVLALLAAGILLIVAGVKLRRKERKDA